MISEIPNQNNDPIFGAALVTPSDTVDIFGAGNLARGLWVGGAGDVNMVMADNTTVVWSAVPAGTLLPFVFKRVKATNTTATLMTAGKRA